MSSSQPTKRLLDLRGVLAPLAVPFLPQGDIDFSKFKRNLQLYENKAPNLKGYVVGGSNSEVATLTPEERVSLISYTKELVSPHKMIIGGATAESSKLAIEMSRAMSQAGADGIFVLSPFYFRQKMTEDVIRKNYERLADESPVPVIIYNNPRVSGIDISTETLVKLADHHNIRGVKDMDVRRMGHLAMQVKGKNFDILAATAGCILPAIQYGCTSAMVGLANVLPGPVCDLYDLAIQGKTEEALMLQLKLIPPDVLLCGELGVPGVKAAMNMLGFEGGLPRAPLEEITSPETLHNIKQALKGFS